MKDKLIEKLKKKYDGKSLNEIEKDIDSFSNTSHENRKAFIQAVYYLETTTRWKEDTRYKATPFKDYILERHNLRDGTYRKEKWAFMKYAKEAKALGGVGVILKMKQVCSDKAVPTVLKKIKVLERNAKRPLDRDQINSVIWSNRKPSVSKAVVKPSVKEFRAANDKLSQSVGDQNKLIKEQAEQIIKLKAAVNEYKPYKKKYEDLLRAAGPLLGIVQQYNYVVDEDKEIAYATGAA